MDRRPADSLNPKLKETYDRIMGGIPQPPPDESPPPQQEVTVIDTPPVPPDPAPAVEEQPRKISAFTPPQTHSTVDAIGVFETPIRTPHHMVKILVILFIVIAVVGYVALWLKIFKLPLPF